MVQAASAGPPSPPLLPTPGRWHTVCKLGARPSTGQRNRSGSADRQRIAGRLGAERLGDVLERSERGVGLPGRLQLGLARMLRSVLGRSGQWTGRQGTGWWAGLQTVT